MHASYRSAMGFCYVILGQDYTDATFDRTTLDGNNGFSIVGSGNHQTRESLGKDVKPLGDINGDGYDDFWLSSRYADYIFWGGRY